MRGGEVPNPPDQETQQAILDEAEDNGIQVVKMVPDFNHGARSEYNSLVTATFIQWFTDYFSSDGNAVLGGIVYEMFGLGDAFGRVMLNNLRVCSSDANDGFDIEDSTCRSGM